MRHSRQELGVSFAGGVFSLLKGMTRGLSVSCGTPRRRVTYLRIMNKCMIAPPRTTNQLVSAYREFKHTLVRDLGEMTECGTIVSSNVQRAELTVRSANLAVVVTLTPWYQRHRQSREAVHQPSQTRWTHSESEDLKAWLNSDLEQDIGRKVRCCCGLYISVT